MTPNALDQNYYSSGGPPALLLLRFLAQQEEWIPIDKSNKASDMV